MDTTGRARLRFEDNTEKLLFEDNTLRLRFEDNSKKLIFDILQVLPLNGIGFMQIGSTFTIG